MCASLHMFSNFRPILDPDHKITIPNGTTITFTHIGDIQVTPDLLLTRVLYVPNFRFNLVSILRLCKDTQSTISFTNSQCWMQGPSMIRPLLFGSLHDGLY